MQIPYLVGAESTSLPRNATIKEAMSSPAPRHRATPCRIILLGAILLLLPVLSLAETQTHDTYKSLETFANVLSLLESNYVQEVNTEEVLQGAIKGMLDVLDPHSSYMKPESFKDLQIETQGSFSGIGIELTQKDGVLMVVSPIEGTPAFKKGVQAGDRIIKIDDQYTKDLSLIEAVDLLRGAKGTEVSISILRKGWTEVQEITLVRDEIPLHSVKARLLEPGYAYVRITNFQAKSTADARTELNTMAAKGAINGLILDLRNNPGGLLEQAVNIADLFLNEGLIVYTDGRLKEQHMEYKAHPGGPQYGFPMVVLVNGGSASASEIVAGALQDHKRALILGEQTFGKGSVQTIFPLNNGAGLRLTTARYYTPNGTSIQAKGITPDLIVPLQEIPDETATLLNTAMIKEKDLSRHISNGNDLKDGKKKGADKETKPPESDEEKLTKADNQLQTGLMLLKGGNLFSGLKR
jgi:carboxyl-terminal processing protease